MCGFLSLSLTLAAPHHTQIYSCEKRIERKVTSKSCSSGFISQNVLAACSFDMIFQYVAVGWEGSASDARVLRWATEEGGFQVPNGRYYLADSGYANSSKFLCPYRNHDYHLAQFNRRPIASRYSCPEELYNHRHAQLRNVIERTFGVLKMRFKILKCMPNYKYRKQTLIVMACCILHNFIKMENQPDFILDASANLVFSQNNASSVGLDEIPTANGANAGDITRTNIKTLYGEAGDVQTSK
ncbi:nuclease [Rhynchospora pubera]|uniref:Nuclease n=1 Tax=Rhynchospora pubera TaxID=906938 RepID=A0AAV8FKN4_9POAL|nr:nuclease [Rhynchospora pubera]